MPKDECLVKEKQFPVDGYVWCHQHGNVHQKTRDPYQMGREDWCGPKEWRDIQVVLIKGDYPPEIGRM